MPELHELVADVWLTRHDAELEEERAARRKGRPKSTKECKLEELKLREAEEYRTGLGESHLTHPEPSIPWLGSLSIISDDLLSRSI